MGGRPGSVIGNHAEKNGKAADLKKELDELFTAQNTSADKNRTSIPATFLRVTVSVWSPLMTGHRSFDHGF